MKEWKENLTEIIQMLQEKFLNHTFVLGKYPSEFLTRMYRSSLLGTQPRWIFYGGKLSSR